MERRKEEERRMIGESSNELIAKRLKKEVFVDSEVWKKGIEQRKDIRRRAEMIDSSGGIGQRRSVSVYDNYNSNSNRCEKNSIQNMDQMKDTLNQ